MKNKLVFTLFSSLILGSSLAFATAAPVVNLEVKTKKKPNVENVQPKINKPQPKVEKSQLKTEKPLPKIEKTQPKIEKPQTKLEKKQPKPIDQSAQSVVAPSVKSKEIAKKTEAKKSIQAQQVAKTKEVEDSAVKAAKAAQAAKAAKRAAEKQAAIDLHNKNAPAYENKDAKLAGAKLTPTVYFLPTFDLDNDKEAQCSDRAKKAILGVDGKKQIKVCPEVYDSCLLQGTCHLVEDGQKITIGYSTQKNGKYYFEIEEGESRCPYGVGVRNVCMDPYFTVAADLRYNKLGDVIYVPEVVGTVLPGGYKHNGFFIVRDKGGAIKGAHRYDFYIGESLPGKETSPFHHLNLQSKKHKKYYYYVKGETADKFREARNFKFPRPKK